MNVNYNILLSMICIKLPYATCFLHLTNCQHMYESERLVENKYIKLIYDLSTHFFFLLQEADTDIADNTKIITPPIPIMNPTPISTPRNGVTNCFFNSFRFSSSIDAPSSTQTTGKTASFTF